ncbi:MAG: hydrogenase/urease maturation nickel metallochaperone HypA [Candidatus Pacearchaeota archaeon]|jgi:Zn finger protein HypA/HybF involved in hydrogenase expression
MHEHSFINAILKNIENPENISKIKIEVGGLAGIEADHLKEHLKDKINGDVEVIEKKAIVKCACGYNGVPKIKARLHDLVIFECPECGKIPEVLEGKDIKIISVVYK